MKKELKNKKYDYVFITLDSSFYKINLYNELSKKLKIYVIFLCKKNKMREDSFLNYEKKFEFKYLFDGTYEERNKVKNSLKIIKKLKSINYKQLVTGGWDSLENWVAVFSSSKKNNSIVIESSEYESKSNGIKGLLKKIYLKRITLGFVSGKSQKNLLKNLKFKGTIIKTKGVGIFNYKNSIKKEKKENRQINKFICVAGLIKVKNIEQLIRVFNELPKLELTIVGKGELEEKLIKQAKNNIKFLGHINNKELMSKYSENDVFILPSLSEAWGLVVEEALSNGLPVILSNKVGCASEVIVDGKHGYIYNVKNDGDLKNKILKIINLDNYSFLFDCVNNLNFEDIKNKQVNSYIFEVEGELNGDRN